MYEACRHGIWKSWDRWHFVTVYVSSEEASARGGIYDPSQLEPPAEVGETLTLMRINWHVYYLPR